MSKVLLILGSGPRTGAGIAAKFASAGYKVALANRSAKDDPSTDYLRLKVDLSAPETVQGVFDAVKAKWAAPSVVVYNGKPWSPCPTSLKREGPR